MLEWTTWKHFEIWACAKTTSTSKYVYKMTPLNLIFFNSFIEIHTDEIVFKYSP